MIHRFCLAFLCGCMLLPRGAATLLHAEDASPLNGWWQGDALTGTWGGLRDRAMDRGISFFTDYTADNLWNTTGGLQTGHAYMGLLEFGVELDLQPLTGWWRGGTFKASGVHTHAARGITSSLVGDLNGVSNIEAPSNSRLYELWLMQTFLNDRLAVQGGNMLVDAYFAFNEQAGTLINAGFGWSQFIAANTGTLVPAYPYAAPGLRLSWRPNDHIEVHSALFDGSALDNVAGELSGNPNGFKFHFNANRWFFISEMIWRRNESGFADGLRGSIRFGGFYHSADVPDLYADVNGDPWIVTGQPPRLYSGTFGLYLAGEQQVFAEEDSTQGLSVFLRMAGLPADRALVNFELDTGLTYTGPFPGRDGDIVSAGYIFTGISGDETRTEELDESVNGTPYAAYSNYEMVFELTYQAWINPWWYVQPDLQYVVHPGGSAAHGNAVVAGFRTGLTF